MSTKYQWSSTSESAEMDGAWVAMDVQNYTISTFNPVGEFIWSCLQLPASITDLVSNLMAEYEVTLEQAEQDVSAFISKLLEIGLVEEVA